MKVKDIHLKWFIEVTFDTWNDSSSPGFSRPIRFPNQIRVWFRNSMRAMKAMRLTAMLAISDIDCDAPLEAASMIFLSWLKNIQLTVWLNIIWFICYQRLLFFINSVYKRITFDGATINFFMGVFLNTCNTIFKNISFLEEENLSKKSLKFSYPDARL